MKNFYCCSVRCLATLLLLAPAGAALAQAPVITGIVPLANTRAVPRTSPVTVSFSQNLTPASAGALKVFSSQRGGLRSRGATPAVVNGNAVSFAPTAYPWMPGETVQYSVTARATGSGGGIARGITGQFITAVGGTGQGNFLPGLDFPIGVFHSGSGVYINSLATGDVDGDGDLDLATCDNSGPNVSIGINNGQGRFYTSVNVTVSNYPRGVGFGDVDGDGDLDLYTSGTLGGGVVSIRLNNGSGVFGFGADVSISGDADGGVALADLDGDGDLDLTASNGNLNTVSVRFNNGTGTFSGVQDIDTGLYPGKLGLGDVDNDGDMDLLVANFRSSSVSVRLNNGAGTFSGTQEVTVGNRPESIALGDVDGDGDLDLVTSNDDATGNANCTASVRINNGSGVFGGGQTIGVGSGPLEVTLGDIDGDGDLDFVTADNNTLGSVSVRLNNGAGVFRGSPSVAVFWNPVAVALADVDNDHDLDVITANYNGSLSVRLNGGTVLAAHAEAALLTDDVLFPNPALPGTLVWLAGISARSPITLLDPLGRPVLTATADAGGRAQLHLPAGLAPGLYLVKTGSAVRRLVVE